MKLNNLAAALRPQRRYLEADSLLRSALAMTRRQRGDDHADLALFTMNLGRVRLDRGDGPAAEALLRDALDRYRKLYPAGSWQIAVAEGHWAESLAALGRSGEAEPLLVASFSTLRRIRGDDHRYTREARRRLIAFYESRGRPRDAAQYRTATTTASRDPDASRK